MLACRLIRNDISSASEVLYPSDSGYNETIRHADQSSTMFSTCSVKPDTVVDVAKVVSKQYLHTETDQPKIFIFS